MMEKLSLDKFEEAYERVQEVVLPTNLVQSDFFSQMTGNKVYFKPENLQLTGAYKIRGAYYKISTLSDEEKAKGLITASAGNHAQGVAYAARKFGRHGHRCYADNNAFIKGEPYKGTWGRSRSPWKCL